MHFFVLHSAHTHTHCGICIRKHWLQTISVQVWIPTAVFFMTIFFGHLLFGAPEDWWLDKLCIHQSREKLKEQGGVADGHCARWNHGLMMVDGSDGLNPQLGENGWSGWDHFWIRDKKSWEAWKPPPKLPFREFPDWHLGSIGTIVGNLEWRRRRRCFFEISHRWIGRNRDDQWGVLWDDLGID